MSTTRTIDENFFKPFFRDQRHAAHIQTTDIFHHLSFHFDGYSYHHRKDFRAGGKYGKENPYFSRLIDERRPSESATIQAYRRSIYLPVTKPLCFKVYNSLKKIVKSPDWKIDFAKAEKPAKIAENEQLEVYTSKNVPVFKSLENWFYTYGIRQMIVDPNALVVVMPDYDRQGSEYGSEESDAEGASDQPSAVNQYLRPCIEIICSTNVLDYCHDDYVVYRSNRKWRFGTENGGHRMGDIIIALTKDKIYVAKQSSENLDFKVDEYKNPTGRIPAFVMGGNFLEMIENRPIYESFVSPILPGLDAAARESSDLDAEVVQHIFSTMWYFSGQECGTCKGVGSVKKEGKDVVCQSCEGVGAFRKSPYKDMVVKAPTGLDEAKIPTPPAGYITKQTEIVTIQDLRIQGHFFRALSAINMEFLAQTPLNQSGKAKEVDRDELNNFVYGVAYHGVENVLVPVYSLVNDWRYSVIIPSPEERAKMLPKIAVPEKFDLLTENIIQDQIKAARDAQVSEDIITYLEIDYINKKFYSNEELRKKLVAAKSLDPLATKTAADKANLLLTDVVPQKDVVISTYIEHFLEQALEADPTFFEKTLDQQKAVIDGFAVKKIAEVKPVKSDEVVIDEDKEEEEENEDAK